MTPHSWLRVLPVLRFVSTGAVLTACSFHHDFGDGYVPAGSGGQGGAIASSSVSNGGAPGVTTASTSAGGSGAGGGDGCIVVEAVSEEHVSVMTGLHARDDGALIVSGVRADGDTSVPVVATRNPDGSWTHEDLPIVDAWPGGFAAGPDGALQLALRDDSEPDPALAYFTRDADGWSGRRVERADDGNVHPMGVAPAWIQLPQGAVAIHASPSYDAAYLTASDANLTTLLFAHPRDEDGYLEVHGFAAGGTTTHMGVAFHGAISGSLDRIAMRRISLTGAIDRATVFESTEVFVRSVVLLGRDDGGWVAVIEAQQRSAPALRGLWRAVSDDGLGWTDDVLVAPYASEPLRPAAILASDGAMVIATAEPGGIAIRRGGGQTAWSRRTSTLEAGASVESLAVVESAGEVVVGSTIAPADAQAPRRTLLAFDECSDAP